MERSKYNYGWQMDCDTIQPKSLEDAYCEMCMKTLRPGDWAWYHEKWDILVCNGACAPNPDNAILCMIHDDNLE